jgi:cellulose synthase/poly-beta-1,6-N-acetylglucosamine synthase-like glycosyltransferase
MNDLRLNLLELDDARPARGHVPIGRHLVRDGVIAQRDLVHALNLQTHIDAPLGDIMIAEGLVSKKDVLSALARQCHTECAELDRDPPHRNMARDLPASLCVRFQVVPWKRDGETLFVATSSPREFEQLRLSLGERGRLLCPVIVDELQIQSHLSRLYGAELAEKAVTRVPWHESCRRWGATSALRTRITFAVVVLMLAALVFAPFWTITIAMLWATLTLAMTTGLKAAALISHLRSRMPERSFVPSVNLSQFLPKKPPPEQAPEFVRLTGSRADAALRMTNAMLAIDRDLPTVNGGDARFRLPRVSVLVPLLREREIAAQLIDRLSRLTYPKSLLDVVLVLEESDSVTRKTIASTALPDWMSVIEVPAAGDLTTKPRALNYALDFCRGSIIGVWDAEDWPEADQIERVVTRFNEAPANVACLQGVLDYYNARTNWLSRCFTIEYATWWRIILPGIARMGLVVPLGGTTLFFRRDLLEQLNGWDAHNVTEDADLGVRLARHGFVTELLPTVTREEATSRAWPWVRQRSRWLKGFMITYFVAMRAPLKLLRELGFLRFMGVQTIFLATVSQFACAPLLWSFWLTLFGFTHPVETTLGATVALSLAGFFLASELLNLTLHCIAVSGRSHRHLIAYTPSMMLYFTLGCVAAYKALWELLYAPFFWDKTQHGVSQQDDRR